MGGLSFAAFGLGAAEKIYDSVNSYWQNKNLARQQQANTRKNMKEQAELEQQGMYNSIVQSTSALKAAGLNPAVAANGGFAAQPSVSHTEALPHADMSHVNAAELAVGHELNRSQIELNEAAAEKTHAEANKLKIQNSREQHLDSSLSSNALSMLSEMRESTDNPFMRGFLDTFIDSTSHDFNLGDYEAFNKLWFEMSQKERDRELDFIQKEFDKKVLQEQYENGAAAALADMPKAKRFEIYAAVHQMNANIARLNAETSLTEDQRSKLRAETSKLGQEVMSIFHSDPAAMYKAGDISSLLVSLGYDAVKAASAGAGFAAGARLAGAGAVKPGIGAAGSFARGLGSGTLKAAKPKGMTPENFEAIKAKARRAANGDKVKEAQYIDRLVRHWHEKYGD